jgi:hypothetical protein
MAWIVPVPPSPRHPRKRWKVVYRDEARRERSAGIYPTEPAARAVRRRIERGDFDENVPVVPEGAPGQQKTLTLFGDYVTTTWWPRWRDGHPQSAYLYGKRIEKRILPARGVAHPRPTRPPGRRDQRPLPGAGAGGGADRAALG